MKRNDTCDCGTIPAKALTGTRPARNRFRLSIILGVSLVLWGLLYYWLKPAADFLTYDILKFPAASHLGSSIAFFVYDVPKVMLLLILIIFVVGIIRSFFTPERTRHLLSGKRKFVGNVMSSALGVVTPFCSCSACPLFIGFVKAGVPLGITFSFLIASPMINEVALVLLYGMFGWRVALIYVVTGLIIAIIAGWVIGKLKMEKFVQRWVYEANSSEETSITSNMQFEDRIQFGLSAVRDIVGKVWPYILAGIAVGAGIHGYVPEGVLASFMGKGAWWSVPAAVLIGVPMYSNAAGIIPVVQALMEKGAALGTVLAFMMAVVGLSLPETMILSRVLKWQLIGVFIGVVAVGIIIVGYLFNTLL